MGRRGSCGAVGPPASGQRAPAIADHGPLTEAGLTQCGWGLASGNVAGLRVCWVRPHSSPFLDLRCWWASGAPRSCEHRTPTGYGWAPCRGLGTGSEGPL